MTNLLLLLLLPFVFSLVLALLPKGSGRFVKIIAFIFSLVPLALLASFHDTWHSALINEPWIHALSVNFHLSVDTLSLIFLYIVAILTPFTILITRSEDYENSSYFYALIMLTQGLLIAFFTSRDLVLFTFFYEAMLFPLYFIIATWGGENRKDAAVKFLLYMFAGSILLIAGVLAVYFLYGTFDIDLIATEAGSKGIVPYLGWIAAPFILAFAVKTPLFPFHGWLRESYTQAPWGGTILLSAILSKAGIYGFLRVGKDIFPHYFEQGNFILLSLAVIGVLYGAFAAWSEKDFKALLAYSSFSHVNFILAGVFAASSVAHYGAVLQSLNHALTITSLFLVAAFLAYQLKSTLLAKGGGIAKLMPKLCWFTFFFVLSSVALPGLNNFIGEVLILFGVFSLSPILGVMLGLSIIFSVVYMLRYMKDLYFGPLKTTVQDIRDLSLHEILILIPLIVLIITLGLYPMPILTEIQKIFTQGSV